VVKKQASIKVLIVHRFTQGMVTNYKNKKVPEVQVVMDMDGFGTKF
jgi:ribosomal protein S2